MTFALIVIYEPLEFGFGAEVHQKAYFHLCGSKIVQDLSLKGALDCARRLELDDNLIVHQEVGAEIAYHLPTKVHRNRGLPNHLEPRFAQGNHHGMLVDRFEKTVPKLVVNLVESTYDFFGHLLMFHLS